MGGVEWGVKIRVRFWSNQSVNVLLTDNCGVLQVWEVGERVGPGASRLQGLEVDCSAK